MNVVYAVLSSGSIGNSYVFTDGATTIMVDAGLSIKQTTLRLANIGLTPENIDALFLTHLPPDHAKTANKLAHAYNFPLYVNEYSLYNDPAAIKKYEMIDDYIYPFDPGEKIKSGSFLIVAFNLYHDAPGTVGYKITHIPSGKVFTIITDTGKVDEISQNAASDADVLFLEANYCPFMLAKGPYPKFLKDRIRSDHGHLSNDDAFDVLNNCTDKVSRIVCFIHRSENNNCFDAIDVGLDIVESSKYSSAYILDRGEFFANYISY